MKNLSQKIVLSIIFSLIFNLLVQAARAQVSPAFTIRGVILDSTTRAPINQALIIVNNDRTQNKSYYTTPNGSFTVFSETPKITVTISQHGYHNKYLQLLLKDSITNLGIIFFQGLSIKLEEVVIKGQPLTTRITQDTIEFSGSAFEVNENALLADLLKKIPGLELTSDGGIMYNGEKIDKILIDGQEYFANNILMALKNISAEQINKLQIITTDNLIAGTGISNGIEKVKILNLTIKESYQDKITGFSQLSYGPSNKYFGNLTVNRLGSKKQKSIIANLDNINGILNGKSGNSTGLIKNAEAAINTSYVINPKNTISSSIIFSNQDIFNESYIRREYIDTVNHGFSLQSNGSSSTTNTVSMETKHTMKLDSLHQLTQKISFKYTASKDENKMKYSNIIGNDSDISGNADNHTKSKNIGYFYNVDFIRKLNNSKGLFTQSFHGGINRSIEKADYFSQYFQQSGDSILPLRIHNFNPMTGRSANLTAISTLQYKLSPNIGLLGFYSATYIQSSNNTQVFKKDSIDPGKLSVIDSLSNYWRYNHQQNYLALGFNIKHRNFESSLYANWIIRKQRVIPTNSELAELNWDFLYPRIDLKYFLTKSTLISFSFNVEPFTISPSQLITTKNFQNPLIVQSGNPNLKNPTKQNMTLRFSSFNPKSLSNSTTILTYSATNQKIVNNVYFDSLGRQVLTPINLDHSKMLSWGTTWSKPFFKRRLAINLRNNILYANDPVAVSGILGTSESLSIAPSLAINYTKKDLIDIQSSFAANRTYSTYNLGAVTKNEVTSLTMNLDVTGYLPLGFIAGVKYNKVINSGLAAGFNRSVDLLNVFVSKRLLKNKMEIKAQGFDLLNKNNSFTRTFTPTYFEDTQSTVLQRFFMGSIIYYIK